MQAFIGATLLTTKEAQPGSKPFEIYDTRLRGFTLRIQPSGSRSYYVRSGRTESPSARWVRPRKHPNDASGFWATSRTVARHDSVSTAPAD